jgi:Ca2+-transporting ATPase
MEFLVVILICLALSFLLSELFYRFNYPQILGPLFTGLILSLPIFREIFDTIVRTNIEFLSSLGIIFLLFLAGLEINIRKLLKIEKDLAAISIFCVVIPFAVGFSTMLLLGYSYIPALVLGVCLSLTAEGSTVKILLDMRALNTKIGTLLVGAGVVDDIFEVIFLSGIMIVAQKSVERLMLLPFEMTGFVIITILTYKYFPKIIKMIQIEKTRVADFSVLLIIVLTIAIISSKLSLGPIIGAFAAGIIINIVHHRNKRHKQHYEEVSELKILTFGLIVPFFFINIGIHFDLARLLGNWPTVLLILFVATAAKIIGALVAKPLTDLNWKQAYLVGWGMNSRGSIELVIAELARMNGLLPIEIYDGVVIMAIFTTMLFPVILRAMIKKDRKIMY